MVLTSYETLNCENIRFSDTFKGTYKTIIPIGIRDEEDNIIPLILSTPTNLLTFGIQEITDKERNNVIGYQLPICLWGKKKITNEERVFTKKIEEIVEYIKEFLFSIKEELNVTDDMIRHVNILNWKYENGIRLEDRTYLLFQNYQREIILNIKKLQPFVDERRKWRLIIELMDKRGSVA